jgi:hypothetical protein
MKLTQLFKHRTAGIELTKLAGADEDVLKHALGDYPQDLFLEGHRVTHLYEKTFETVESFFQADVAKMTDISVSDMHYHPPTKAIYASVLAEVEMTVFKTDKSGRGSEEQETLIEPFQLKYKDNKCVVIEGAAQRGPKFKEPLPTSDDDIDLLLVLPGRVIDEDWR